MSDETNEEVPMAECGACRAIVPLNSDNCPECNISFTGVSDEALGECGACHGLVPLDSTKCPHCGTIFVADDVVEVLRKWLETTGITIPTLFKKFDTNNDNLIDSSELKTGLLSLNLADLPPSQVERLVKTIDEDGDGQIDLSELHETITGEKYESDENELKSTFAETEDDNTSLEMDDEPEDDAESSDGTEDDVDSDSKDSTDVEDSTEIPVDANDVEEDPVGDEDAENSVDESEDIEDFEEDELDEDYVDEMDNSGDDIGSEIQTPQSILQLISDAMDESGDSPNKFFNALDSDGNGQISAAEFTESISELLGTEVTHKDIESFLSDADEDNDGTIDIIEFVEVLESLDDVDDAIDDEARLSKKTDKPFPTDLQKKMMGKKWNDVVWPLIHMAFGLFIAAWLINGMGGIGPLGVSGEGGNVALETNYKVGYESWLEGDIYPCDPDVQVGECRNSLTPFSGDSSSMPAGFYLDGIVFMILGLMGLIGSLAMHFVVVPGWRARSKAMKEVSDDTDEARTENSNDEDDSDANEDDDELEEEDDGELEEEDDDELEEEDDDELEDEDEDELEEDDEDDDDEIDIGSHIGLAFEDEEVFGTIIEFDDEEETVTIEEDGSGDVVTGYQKDIFLE